MFGHAISYDDSKHYDHNMAKRSFHIHEDHLAVNHMSEEQETEEQARSQTESQSQTQRADDDYDEPEDEHDDEDTDRGAIEGEENEDHDDADDNASESSEEDDQIDVTVQQDMEKLRETFPDFTDSYRLIKRIGEGISRSLPSHAACCPINHQPFN